jgi:5-methylcytosine-specific restriction endonuclease McrBC regulatory subunit McrC
LTYDNLDNRLILQGLRKAINLAGDFSVRQRIEGQLNIFRFIASEALVADSDFEMAERGYNRLNEHYRVAHALCRMLLFGLRPQELFKVGKEEVFGVVMDMANIFESFVERFLLDLLGREGYKLYPQARDSRAILDAEGYRYASVQPDIEIWRGNRLIGMVDAKYKPYWAMRPDGFSPDRKISNEDLYQLFFYQQRMQRKYGLTAPPAAVIAAPLPEEDERGERLCVPNRFQRFRWQAGLEKEGDIRLILIPMTRFLRLLSERFVPVDAIHVLGLNHIPELLA